jgi:hypothetical protein
MNNPTYQERVTAIAEEMAKEKHPLTFLCSEKNGHLWATDYYKKQAAYVIELMLPAARIAVKHMAEAVTRALQQDYAGFPGADGVIHTWLIEQGLMPDTDQKANSPLAEPDKKRPQLTGYNTCETCGEESKTTKWRKNMSSPMCDICYSKYKPDQEAQQGRENWRL